MSGSSTSKGDYQPEDAQRQAEAATEDRNNVRVPVDVSADYEASKNYSVSEVDKSGGGAEAATRNIPGAEKTKPEFESTGEPDDYRSMAKDVNPNV